MHNHFVTFSTAHIIVIAQISLFSIIAYFGGKAAYINQKHEKLLRHAIAGFLIFQYVTGSLYSAIYETWDVSIDLPVQLCDMAYFLCCVMLITRKKLFFELTYFIALVGGMQAVITPGLIYGYNHFLFYFFFFAHGGMIIACIYAAKAFGFRLGLRSVFRAIIAVNIFAVIAFAANLLTGGNYMFLSHKPLNPSILEILSPWPFYILETELIAVFLFGIYLLPYVWGQIKLESSSKFEVNSKFLQK